MSLTLTADEIREVCGGLTQPSRQLEELHAQGFWRARLKRGEVIVERAHYEAVCAGALPPIQTLGDTNRPQVRLD